MNTKAIRFRLTALYSSALIVSLAILFTSFYWVTQKELYNHTDSTLRSHASRITTILTKEPFQIDRQMSSQLLTDVFNEIPGMLVIITNAQGDVLSVSQNITGVEKIASTLIRKRKDGNESIFSNYSIKQIERQTLQR